MSPGGKRQASKNLAKPRKRGEPLGDVMRELATMPLRSEADVTRFWIPRLLSMLGYTYPAEIENERPLRDPFIQRGRRRLPVVFPDLVVSGPGGPLFVIEAKAPSARLDPDDVRQAHSYAAHPEVSCPFFVLTTGRSLAVYESRTARQLLVLNQDDFANEEMVERLKLLLSKQTLGRSAGCLHLERKIGEGGFGIVYRAWNPLLERYEALKLFRSLEPGDGERWTRFLKGQRALARLRHPNIAEVYGPVQFGGAHGVSMYFSAGVELSRWCRRRRSITEKLMVLRQLCDAVGAAHAQDVVHRDIKPANILIEESAEGPKPILVDFDTATWVGAETFTRSRQAIGTIGFIAPELSRASLTRSSMRAPVLDTYSLGALLHFMVFGRVPEVPCRPTFIHRRVARLSVPGWQASGIELILMKSLEPDPRCRYQDGRAMLHDVEALLKQEGARDRDRAPFLEEIWTRLDAVIAQRSPVLWGDAKPFRAHGQEGRYFRIPGFGEAVVLFDDDYYGFLTGYSFPTRLWQRVEKTGLLPRLRKRFGRRLEVSPASLWEEGGATLFYPLSEQLERDPALVAEELVADLIRFEEVRLEGAR